MKIGEKNYRSIWADKADPGVIKVIDQERLPFFFEIKDLRSVEDVYTAIKDMTVRGAPAIGAAGAYGMYLATLEISLTHKHSRPSRECCKVSLLVPAHRSKSFLGCKYGTETAA